MSVKVVMFSTLFHILSFGSNYMKYVIHRHDQVLDISPARPVLPPSLAVVPMKIKEATKKKMFSNIGQSVNLTKSTVSSL